MASAKAQAWAKDKAGNWDLKRRFPNGGNRFPSGNSGAEPLKNRKIDWES